MTGYESKRAMAQAKVEGPIHVVCQCDKCKAQPAQEPVAWGYRNHDGAIYDCISPEAHADAEGDYTVPLYTTPPQRTWVGLTDEEAQWLYDNCRTPSNLIDMVEARLKDKNT
jgi:hypothetical protein